jgi:hypothetical protein
MLLILAFYICIVEIFCNAYETNKNLDKAKGYIFYWTNFHKNDLNSNI